MKSFRMHPFILFGLMFTLLCGYSPLPTALATNPVVTAADTSDYINWEENKIILLLNKLFSITNNPCNKDTLNTIIEKITGGTGSLHIPIKFKKTLLKSTVNITGVTIAGLDTITEATLFKPVDKYSLYNHLKFDNLQVILRGNAIKSSLFSADTTETFSYTASLVDAAVNATVLLGVSSTVLGGLYIDQLNLGCLASSIEDVNVTSHHATATTWTCDCEETVTSSKGSPFVCHSFISKGVCSSTAIPVSSSSSSSSFDTAFDSSFDVFEALSMFGDSSYLLQNEMDDLFENVMQSVITEVLNFMSDKTNDNDLTNEQEEEEGEEKSFTTLEMPSLPSIPTIPSLSSLIDKLNCSEHVPNSHGSPPESYVNFIATDTLWSKIAALTASLDVASIDAAIACSTEQSSGTAGMIDIAGDLFDLDLKGTHIEFHDLLIKGIDSISQLSLLQPIDEYDLQTHIGINHLIVELGIDVSKPSSTSEEEMMVDTLTSSSRQNGLSFDMTGSYELKFNMTQFKLIMSSYLQIDLSQLDDLTLNQLTTKGCVVSSFDSFQLTELVLKFKHAYLTIMPTSTSLTNSMFFPHFESSSSTSSRSRDSDNLIRTFLILYTQILSNDYNYMMNPDNERSEGLFYQQPEISLPTFGNGITIDLASELDKLLNNTGSKIDRFIIDNLLTNANATCHHHIHSTDDDGIERLPTFDDDQEGIDAAAWEGGMGGISFVVMFVVIALSVYFSWQARTSRRRKAEAKGHGHLGNEFVVVRANDVLASNNDGQDEYLKLDGGDDDDDDVVNAATKASIAKPIHTLHNEGGGRKSSKHKLLSADHLTDSGKHFDEDGNEIDEKDIVDSLFQSERIGTGYRYGIPGCCVCIILLFISANVFNGAAVYASVQLGPLEPVQTADFFDFTLQNSVHDFWEAKVYFLSILVALLSGAVPYLKLLLIIICWIAPMKRGWRQFVFNWVDALGKWSLLDSYVLVAMMVAFNFKIFLGPTHTGHDEPIKITVYTKPEYGFYSFLIATMCSMALGHAATFFHRYDSSPVERIPAGGPKESLSCHLYQPQVAIEAEKELKLKQKESRKLKRDLQNKKNGNNPYTQNTSTNSNSNFNPIYEDLISDDEDINHLTDDFLVKETGGNGSGSSQKTKIQSEKSIERQQIPIYEREKPSCMIRYGIVFIIIATFSILMAGGFLFSFEFTFGGLTGYILKKFAGPGSTPVSTPYSLISAYEDLPKAYPEDDDLGIWFIQQAYLLYGFWVPALHLCLLLALWLIPMTLRTQATGLALGEIANAWSAVDVFIFSIFAALLQISKFAAFIVEGLCGSPVAALGGKTLNEVIGQLFNARNIDEAHTCLDVQASLIAKGAVPLFIAGASVFLTSQLVLSYAKAAVHDRLDHLVPTGFKLKRESILMQDSLIKSDVADLRKP